MLVKYLLSLSVIFLLLCIKFNSSAAIINKNNGYKPTYSCESICSGEFEICTKAVYSQLEHFMCVRSQNKCRVRCTKKETKAFSNLTVSTRSWELIGIHYFYDVHYDKYNQWQWIMYIYIYTWNRIYIKSIFILIFTVSLHKKWSFTLKTSSVNV